VGATGSIGAACARLLAKVAGEVMLVSPETAKLLAPTCRPRRWRGGPTCW
jgi:short-subunit dehydrogenase